MNLFQLMTDGVNLDALPTESENKREPIAFEPSPSGGFSVPSDLNAAFDAAASDFGIDADVLRAVAHTESRFNPDVVSGKVKSRTGAIGLMQFMPDTAKEYGINPVDPVESIFGAAAYLRKSLDKFDGDYGKAVASYNAGPNRKDFDSEDWDKRMPAETQDYLRKVFTAADKLKQGAPAAPTPQPATDTGDETARLAARYKAPRMERTMGQAVSDTGAQLAEGVNNILGAVPNLIAPDSGVAQFFKGNADTAQNWQSDAIKQRTASAGAAIDKAGEDGVIAQVVEAAKQYSSDPALAARFVVTNLPSMIPGIGAAKLAQAAALARGATLAQAAATATTVAGGMNAALNAGGARGEAFDDLKATLMKQGVPEAKATEQALTGSLLPAAIGGVAGFISGKTGLEGAIVGKAGAKAAVTAGAKSLGAELGGEQLEEVAPKLATNYQASQFDNRSLGKDVGRTMVETAIGSGPGSIFSGVQAAANTRTAPTVESQPTTPTAPPVVPATPNPDASQAVGNIASLIKQAEAQADGAPDTAVTSVEPEKQAASFAQRTATPTPLPGAVPQTTPADAGVRAMVDSIKKKRAQDAEETLQIQQMLAEDDAKAEALRASSTEETTNGQAEQIAIKARASLIDDLVSSYAEPSEFFASRVLPAVDKQLAVLGRPPLAKDERARVDALLGSTRAFIRPSLPSAPEAAPVLTDAGADNSSLERLIKPKKPAVTGLAAEMAALKARSQPQATQPDAPAAPQPVTGGLAAEMSAIKSRNQAATTVDPAKPAPVGIGRNNTPLAEGGKPFKTKAEADTARKLQPMMRVKKEGKGFVLVEKTPAQIAAQEKAARRNLGSVGAGGGPLSAHAFLASQGGLSKSAMADLGFDKNVRVGSKWLFTNTGMTLEGMTEALQQNGYVQSTEQNPAIELVKRSANGQPQYTAEGWDQIAQAEATARFEDHLAAQQEAAMADDEFDPFSPENLSGDFEGDDLDVAGYDAMQDPIKLEVNALLDKAEALGIDTDTIKETAYEDTKNEPEQAYFERVRAELTRAINASTGSRSNQEADGNAQVGQGPDAQRGSRADSREGDGREGAPGADSEGLTGQANEAGAEYSVRQQFSMFGDEQSDQLQLFIDSQPAAGQDGPGGLAAKQESVTAVADLHSTGSILAQALSSDYAARQRVSLVGQTVSSTADLAVLAQVYRDPRFETFRVVFTDENNKVVSQLGLTSRLPTSVAVVMGDDTFTYLKELSAAAQKTGATGYYLMHNHPSGKSQPSQADLNLTRDFARPVPGLEFKSHVVLDTNEYATIDAQGTPKIIQKDFGQPAPLNANNPSFGSPQDVVAYAKSLQVENGAVTLIATDSQYKVKAVTTIPESALTGSRGLIKLKVARALMRVQSSNVMAVGRDIDALKKLNWIVTDAIYIEPSGQFRSLVEGGVMSSANGGAFPDKRRTRVTADSSPEFAYLRHLPSSKTAGQRVKEGDLFYASSNSWQSDLFGSTEEQAAPVEVQKPEAVEPQPAKQEVVPEQSKPEKPASKTPTVDAHSGLMDAVRSGNATPEQFKTGFEAAVSSADVIKAELGTYTKADLLKIGGPYMRMRYASENKPAIIDALHREMLGEFTLGESFIYGMGKDSHTNAIRRMVDATDANKLAKYAEERKAAIEEAVARRVAAAKSVIDPKTLDDFKAAIRAAMMDGKSRKEAYLNLTPEQRIRYDELDAESTREARETRKRTQKTQVQAAGQTTGGQIIATKHTRDGYDLFVVQLSDRLSKEDYSTVLASAKRMGGWYSAFRGNGATPGFQFKEKASADAFLKLAGGDTAAAKDQAAQRRDAFEDDRSQTASERLTEMADRLEAQADAELGRDRKANTARRARFAASAEKAASNVKALAKTMRNIATAIGEGKAKFLDAVRQKTQVEMLAGVVHTAKYNELVAQFPDYGDREKRNGEPPTIETADFAEFPAFTAFRSDLAGLARQMLEVDGTKKLGQQLMGIADDVTDAYLDFAKENLLSVSQFGRGGSMADFGSKATAEAAIRRSGLVGKAIVLPIKRGENRVILSPSEAMNRGVWEGDGDKRITLTKDAGMELVEAIGRKGNKTNGLKVPWQFETAADRLKALSRMGIETPSEFRSAVREFISLRVQAQEADRVKAMERAMVGRRSDGLDFFPTPADVADQMVEAAEVQAGMRILEPSAGMGHLADRIRAAGAEPDVVELSGDRRELLEEKGYNVVANDFTAFTAPTERGFTFGDLMRATDGAQGILRGQGGMGSDRVRLVSDDAEQRELGKFNLSELEGIERRGVDSGYDRIIMNPPFGDRRDAEHVRHAYSLLKPGGRLVAIMGEGVFFGKDKKAEDFREWLDTLGGTSEKLPDGSFMDPSLPVTTGVNARMVVVDKPSDAPSFSLASDQSPRTPASTIRTAITKAYGNLLQRLEGKGLVSLTQTEEEAIAAAAQARADQNGGDVEAIKQAMRASVLASEASDIDVKRSADGNLEGFFDPATGKSFLIADNLTAESAPATLMHEVGIHMAADGKLEPLFTRAGNLLKLAKNDPFIQRVQSRMDESGETSNEEAAAYIVTEYEKDRTNAPQSVVNWVKDFIADVRAWLFSKGVLLKADQMTVADIAAVARANARGMANGVDEGQGNAYTGPDANNSPTAKDIERVERLSAVIAKGFGIEQPANESAYKAVSLPDAVALQSIGSAWGKRIIGFDLAAVLKGKSSDFSTVGGVSLSKVYDAIFISLDNDAPHLSVLGHELAHHMRLDEPQIYDDLVVAIRPFIKQEAYRQQFGKELVAAHLQDPDLIREEFIGEVLADGFMEPAFWNALGETSPSLLTRVVDAVVVLIDKARAAVGMQRRTEKYLTDFNRVMEIAGDAMARYAPDAATDIRRSVAGGGQQNLALNTPSPAWMLPQSTKTDALVYELQDQKVDLKRTQEAIKEAGRTITESFDARMAETLMPGRVAYRTETFLKTEVAPLMEAMARNNVSQNELSDYLLARHAPERNTQIAKVNPEMPDGGAGTNSQGVLMTTQAAQDHIAALTAGKRTVLQLLANKIDAITANTRDMLVREGLEKQSTMDAWTGAYKHYVPLFKDEAVESPAHPIGSGLSVTGSASKRAMGSEGEVTNMVAHILMQRESAITRAEKNRVAMSLYGLALSNPNPQVWTTIRPNMSAVKIGKELAAMGVDPVEAEQGMQGVPTIRTINQVTGLVQDTPNPMYKRLENALVVKVDGEDRVVLFNATNPDALRMVRALKNQDGLTNFDLAGSMVGTATRYFASVNTQYNPAFGMVNVVRDIGGALVNLSTTDIADKKAKVLGDIPAAMKGIARDVRGDQQRTPWSDLWVQFQEDGGRTGYRDLFIDPFKRAEAVQKDLDAMQRDGSMSTGKVIHGVLDLLDDFNTTLENGVRLSAYKAALDKGMSRPAAAKMARELTVDFNRKGRTGRELGPLYAFFNASVQGTARTIESLKGPAGKKIIAGGLMLGVMQSLMLAAAGFDDDEPPEFVKARAFIIPMGDKKYIAIPLQFGLNALPNTGRVITDLMMTGGKDWQKKSFDALGEVMGSFNPLGGGNIFTAHGALTMVAPTVADPLIDLATNTNFAGAPIGRERSDWDTRPGDKLARESTKRSMTGQVYIGISKAVNAVSGGNEFKKGLASPTPEQVQYVFTTAGGGLYRELEKTLNIAGLKADGFEIKSRMIPLGGRFAGEVDDQDTQRSRYFKNVQRLGELDTELKGFEKADNDAEVMRIETERKDEADLLGDYKAISRDIAKLNKQAAENITDVEQLKELDAERLELMRELNDSVRKLEKRSTLFNQD